MKSCLKYFVLLFCLNFNEGSQLFRCDYTYSAETKGWFKYVAEPATWYNAQEHCAQQGAVLASPTANEIDDGIVNILNSTANADGSAIYTGLHATRSDPVFRDADGTSYPEFRDWEPNQSNNTDRMDACVIMYNNGDGSFEDVSCEETFPYVCYRSASPEIKVNECGTVDPEYHLDNRTNKCYKYHNVTKNFSQAVVTCAAEGGHLVIINSDTEAKILSEIFTEHPLETLVGTHWPEIAFIGIYNYNKKRDWRTIHGQVLEDAGYARFSPGEPNNAGTGQYCGSIYRNGLIDDIFCYEPAVFICEKSPDYNAACSLPDDTVEGFYKPQDDDVHPYFF